MYLGGLAKVTTGALSVIVPMALRITQVRLGADTAPVGSTLILDLNKNGSTIYTTQANRPELPPGVTDAVGLLPDITTLDLGDKLRLDIDQVGSLAAGAGLSLTIICEVV